MKNVLRKLISNKNLIYHFRLLGFGAFLLISSLASYSTLLFEENFNVAAWENLNEPLNTFTNTISPGSLLIESVVPQSAITNFLGSLIASNGNEIITYTTNQVTASNLVFSLTNSGNKGLLDKPSYSPMSIMYFQKPDTNMNIPIGNHSNGVWISWAMQKNDAARPHVGFYTGNSRFFELGINSDNQLYALTSTNSASFVSSNSIPAPAGVVHLAVQIVSNYVNEPSTAFRVYVNPPLGNDNLGTPTFNFTNPYQANPVLTLMRFACSPTAGNYLFDEIRGASSFLEAAPSALIATQLLDNATIVTATTNLVFPLYGKITVTKPKKLKPTKLDKAKGFTVSGKITELSGFDKTIKDPIKIFVGIQRVLTNENALTTNWVYFAGKSKKVNRKGTVKWKVKKAGVSLSNSLTDTSSLRISILAYSNTVSSSNHLLQTETSIPLK